MLDINIFKNFDSYNVELIENSFDKEINKFNRKIIVLDDDPTGIQTVHNVFVYTDWSYETIKKAFEEKENMFFILTNSRSFTREKTYNVHKEIAENISKVYLETKKEFIIISRGDSTLRGHYPLETETLREVITQNTKIEYNGEIISPFFKEGGRFTIDDIHYVLYGNNLIPAAETEFAKDKSFGYNSSNLREWCLEKTNIDNSVSISIKELRSFDKESIKNKLLNAKNFQKIIVNAIDYIDLKAFAAVFIEVLNEKNEYIFRSAASMVKVLGNIKTKSLLTKKDIIDDDNKNGGLIIIGSHVKKTTIQLEKLKEIKRNIKFIEFNQHRVFEDNGLDDEVKKTIELVEDNIKQGITAAVYTRRDRIDLPDNNPDKQLEMSVKISDAITKIVSQLQIKPSFIISKGGITSSDIGTKGLMAKKSLVLGQIENAVPVWLTGDEAKFKNMPYIIFPGNVGNDDTLKNIVEKLLN